MPSTDTSVRFYASTMSGAPTLSGTAGSLIALIDALRTGFGTVTTSLVVASNTATATINTGHNFLAHGMTGPVIEIAGATPAGLNGVWRVTIIDGNTFTFTTTGISDQTASGTITAKMAPLLLDKPFSGTNKAAYKWASAQSSGLYLRIDDSSAQYPTAIMYETMSDVDTGTGATPTLYTGKSTTANSTARAWRVFADHMCLYFFADNGSASAWASFLHWGDITSALSTDAYYTFIIGHATQTTAPGTFSPLGNTTGKYFARDYTQTGGAVAFQMLSHQIATQNRMGDGTVILPNPAGSEYIVTPITIHDSSATIYRGDMPGIYSQIHPRASLTAGGVTYDTPAKSLYALQIHSSASVTVDLTGPWR